MAATLFGQGRNEPRGKAGEFDFYLLSLSWSPQYCSSPAGARDNTQCGGQRQYEFILHGLWPQYDRGWPQFCATSQTLSNALVEKMMDIMPSRRLIRHEWDKHGVCTGLSAAEYFGKARAAFSGIKVPKSFQSPKNARTISPAKIKDEVARKNILAPYESSLIPLPHQILVLEKVMQSNQNRFILADEVGMGKTIETGLILKELKIRAMVCLI